MTQTQTQTVIAEETWDEYLNELWDRGKTGRAAYREAMLTWKESGDDLSAPARSPNFNLAACGCLPQALELSPCPGHPDSSRNTGGTLVV